MLRVASLSLAACSMTGTYLDARTPPAGTFRYAYVVRAAAGRDAEQFPTVDVAGSYSPTDDTSLHLRTMIGSLGSEAAFRWRFVHTDHLHLALAPSLAFGYWPATRGVEEDTPQKLGAGLNALARANLLAAIDLGGADLDLAAFAGFSHLPESAVPAGDDAPYAFFDYNMQGVVSIAGGALGFTFPGGGGLVRPSLECMRFIRREVAAGASDPPFRAENVYTFTLTFEQ